MRDDDQIMTYYVKTIRDGLWSYCPLCDQSRTVWVGDTEGGDRLTCCCACQRVLERIKASAATLVPARHDIDDPDRGHCGRCEVSGLFGVDQDTVCRPTSAPQPLNTFVTDETIERNIARDLRHTPERGDGSGGWVMSVRYLVKALAAAREALRATPAASDRETTDALFHYQRGYADAQKAATPASPSFQYRCSGCGLRWHTTEPGSVTAELCGDCWRKVQPILHVGC